MPVLRRTHVTDIADVTSVAVEDGTAGRKRKGSGLDAMLLSELKQLAGSLGIRGAGTLRKGQLIAAIQGAQSGPAPTASAPGAAVNGSSSSEFRSAETNPVLPAAPESSAGAPDPVLSSESAGLADGAANQPVGTALRQGAQSATDSRAEGERDRGDRA